MFWGTHEAPPEAAGPVQVPDFSYPDESGRPVVLSQIRADVRVVNFWASWSPYSKDELPALVALKREFGDRVAVIALNRDTYSADGRAFLESLGLEDELVFAYDQDDSYFVSVGGYNMPETIFLGEDEEVLHHVHGPMTLDAMRTQVTRLLEGMQF
jgi:thiol-disulfide isomerase/thioredoxin